MNKVKKTYNFNINDIKYKNKELIIEMKCDFVPASRPRVARFGTYIAEPYKTFKNEFSKFVKNNLSKYGEKFKGNSLSVDMTFYKQIPKSYTKKKREECLKNGCTTRPDIDNYYKAILDSMDNVFYTDDSYIVELSGRKLYTDNDNYIILKIKNFNGVQL